MPKGGGGAGSHGSLKQHTRRYNRQVHNEAGASPARNRAARPLAGFFLSGFLLAFAGAILPAWGYHRDPPEFMTVGCYFLSIAAAVIASHHAAGYLLKRGGASLALVSGCALATAGLAALAVASPPAGAGWRMAGVAVMALGAGLLNTGLFHAISGAYVKSPAETVAKAGILYGLGCLAVTLFVAGTLYTYTVSSLVILLAVVPGMFAGVYANSGIPAASAHGDRPGLRQAFQDFRSPGAVLFALLLFFQFGNEWSLAAWLPLFLVRRLGISPVAGLLLVALYWVALLGGRVGAVYLVRRVRGRKLLPGSALAAIFGLTLLAFTNNEFGAAAGVVCVGAGFACIFPLVAENIGRRFPYYHPAFFNGIFSFALMGAMLAPATLGFLAEAAGLGVVMALPLAGMCMVSLLLFLIWLEAKVTGR